MQNDRQAAMKLREECALPRVLKTVYCPRDGRRVSVIFEFSGSGEAVRTGVAFCPRDTNGNRFTPPLGGEPCDAACLAPASPVTPGQPGNRATGDSHRNDL